ESFTNQMLSAIEKVRQERKKDKEKFLPTPRDSQNNSFLDNLLRKEFIAPLGLFLITLFFLLINRWRIRRRKKFLKLIKFRLEDVIAANNLKINMLNERNKFFKKYLSTSELLTPIIFESFLKLKSLVESINGQLMKIAEEKSF